MQSKTARERFGHSKWGSGLCTIKATPDYLLHYVCSPHAVTSVQESRLECLCSIPLAASFGHQRQCNSHSASSDTC